MRTWSWILGFVAVALSLFVAVNWTLAAHHSKVAEADKEKFAALSTMLQDDISFVRRDHKRQLELDQQSLESRQSELMAAYNSGNAVRFASALRSRNLQTNLTYLARAIVQLDQQEAEDVPVDPGVGNARDRSAAAQASFNVYAHAKTRDEHLGYVAAALWLAFGFAVALSKRT